MTTDVRLDRVGLHRTGPDGRCTGARCALGQEALLALSGWIGWSVQRRGSRVYCVWLVLETIFTLARQTKKSVCRKARRAMAYSELKSRVEGRVSLGSRSVTCRFGHALGSLRQETPLLMTRSLPWSDLETLAALLPRSDPSCPRQHRFLALGLVRTGFEVSNQTLSNGANLISRSSPARHAQVLRACRVPSVECLRGYGRRHVLVVGISLSSPRSPLVSAQTQLQSIPGY